MYLLFSADLLILTITEWRTIEILPFIELDEKVPLYGIGEFGTDNTTGMIKTNNCTLSV